MGFTALGIGGSVVFNPSVSYTFTALETFAAGITVSNGPITFFTGMGNDPYISGNGAGDFVFNANSVTLQALGGMTNAPLICGGISVTSGNLDMGGGGNIILDGGSNSVGTDDAIADALALTCPAGLAIGQTNGGSVAVPIYNGSVQILSGQQPAVADATALTVVAQLNALLAALRVHGLIRV